MTDQTRDSRIAVITVHGTGDTAATTTGEKWFQNGSAFAGRLTESLSSRGVNAEIIPHLWTGANSANAREKGALSLAKRIRQLSRQGRDVHVIGHSHGGNVANDAACMLGWSMKQHKPKLSSVTTVGTPFFRTHVTVSERLGAWAFVVMTVVSIAFMLAASAYLALDASTADTQMAARQAEISELRSQAASVTTEEERKELQQRVENLETSVQMEKELATAMHIGVGAVVTPSWIVLIFMFPLALRGIGRIRRAGRKSRGDTSLFSIWHPNDEAIAFLMRVEELPIEPFPRWSFLRSSRTSAIVWGIRAVCAFPIAGLLLILGGMAMSAAGSHQMIWDMEPEVLGIVFIIYGLAGAPLVFAAVYILFRLAVAVVLEMGLRGTLNRSIGGVLKGLAFGRDGDNRIGNVAPCSHYYAAKKQILEGEVASRMLNASQKATQELFNKYRGSMFAVGVNNTDAISQLSTDAMTWDSLIHTTYFDQPEVAGMIAGHIADSLRMPKTRPAKSPVPAPTPSGQPVAAE
jgi:hypothetical protein